MTSNLWKNIELFCGCEHELPSRMILTPVKKGYEYTCEHNTCGCRNSIPLRSFEKMVDYLSDKLSDAEIDGSVINFTNYKWKDKLLTFQIIEHNSIFKIEVINKEKLV